MNSCLSISFRVACVLIHACPLKECVLFFHTSFEAEQHATVYRANPNVNRLSVDNTIKLLDVEKRIEISTHNLYYTVLLPLG